MDLLEERLHADAALDDFPQTADGDALLKHRVAVTEGHATIFEGIVVDGDAVRRTDGVLATVAFADGVFLIILAVEVEAQVVEDFAGLFGQAVFLDQRQDGQFDRSQAGGQPQHDTLFAVIEFLFGVGRREDGQEGAVGGTFQLTVDGDLFKVTVSLPVLTVEEAVTIN